MKEIDFFNPPPELRPFLQELLTVCLFPDAAQDEILDDIAREWCTTSEEIRKDFEFDPELSHFFRLFWTRILEPTSGKYHEITPLVARVRCGKATDREKLFLGIFSVAAIENSDKEALDALHRLATKKIKEKGANQVTRGYFDYFRKHRRLPGNAELQRFIQQSSEPEKYALVTDDNWSRHVKTAAIEYMFRHTKKL